MSNRMKAFVIHGGISLFILILFLVLIFYVWYPEPLARGMRVIYLAGLIVFINNVIAPFLVLMVYKQGKKNLVLLYLYN